MPYVCATGELTTLAHCGKDPWVRTRGYPPATPCLAELVTADPAASADFYTRLFGWHTEDSPGRRTFTLDGLVVAALSSATANHPNGWLPHISTEDLTVTAEAIKSAGGSVLTGIESTEGQGSSMVVADPEGAVFALWQAAGLPGAQLVSQLGAPCWTDLRTRDTGRAELFYGTVFGWKEQPGETAPGMDYSEWWSRGRVVAGMAELGPEVPPLVPAAWHSTFEVADCAEVTSRCADLGGRVLLPPMDIGIGEYTQLADPLGASFGVIHLPPHLHP
jgi:predicted enzyme related to lactoylglutathione lyase